jgi:hypothetical protein
MVFLAIENIVERDRHFGLIFMKKSRQMAVTRRHIKLSIQF